MACLAPAPLPLPLFQLPSPYLTRPTRPRSSSPPSPWPDPSRSFSFSPEAQPFQLPSPYLTRPTPPRSSSPPSPSPSPDPSRSSSLSREAQPFQPRVEWKRPPAGWLKLNFDGSVYNDGSGRASIGGVIRNCTGRVLAAFAETTEHTTSVGIVEARALIFGLRLALRCGFSGPLVVEGDDRVLVKLLLREDTYTRIPGSMEEEIRMLLGRFSAHDVKHIFREGNQVADALCHEAYHQTWGWMGGLLPCLPRAAEEKAQDDRNGVKYERIRKTKV